MASPVKLQGIVTVVLLGVLLVMIGAGIVSFAHWRPKANEIAPGGWEASSSVAQKANPLARASQAGASIADIKLVPPVIYCIDAGSSMAEVFSFAAMMTRVSIRGLKGDETFNVMVCLAGSAGEAGPGNIGGAKLLLEDFSPGGPEGEARIAGQLEAVISSGRTNIAHALDSVVGLNVGSIVLFARKPLDNEVVEVARKARTRNVRIVTIALDADEAAAESLAALAKISGGKSRAYSYGKLSGWAATASRMD